MADTKKPTGGMPIQLTEKQMEGVLSKILPNVRTVETAPKKDIKK